MDTESARQRAPLDPAGSERTPPGSPGGEASRRLSWLRIAGYCSGVIPNNIVNSTVQALALPIYSVALGVPAAWVGYAISIPRLLDALSDPYFGSLSDNLRGRWGRRRPLMVAGAIACGVLYALLWMPPAGLTASGLTAYFAILAFLLYLAFALYIVPFLTLGNELSADRSDRTRIMSTRVFFIGLPGFVLPWTLSLCYLPWWGGSEVVGARAVGVVMGTLIIGLGLLAALASREPEAAQASETTPFLEALRATAANRPFLLLAVGKALALVTVNTVLALAFYVGYYHVFPGSKVGTAAYLGGLGTAWAMTTLGSGPLLGFLASRIGPAPVILTGCGSLAVGGLSTWVTFDSRWPYLAVISYGAMSLGLASVWVVAYLYLAEVCDADERASGRFREGIYSSVFAFIEKAGAAVAVGISGQLIGWAGVPRDATEPASEGTVFALRLIFAVAPALFGLLAFGCFARFLATRTGVPAREGSAERSRR
jgi:glycoside/pentoside/hexuronide:cation symporter, GPH family